MDEARPRGIAKNSATTVAELTESRVAGTGASLDTSHLDGRKVKTSLGEIVQPMIQELDPFENDDGK